ncbi:MAG: methyltransferase [Candidatus Thermoplasmatota archaeon]|nr:methyltransferase [Candidatus Thermoplasmatota archaeon]
MEKIPSHPDPSRELEQYSTPASIAADILFTALANGHITEKVIADLGCGTGIFAIGSAFLKAEKVKAVDVDEKAIEVAREEARIWSVSETIEFEAKDVKEFHSEVQTVIMNPPFGSQKKGADIPFLETAFDVGEIVYSLHNAKTIDFLERFINKNGHSIFWEKRYMFEIHNLFKHHEKEKEDFEVILLGINIERE